MSAAGLSDKARHNVGIALRLLAASLGGYAFTALLSVLLRTGLPVEAGNAASTAQLVSYLIWPALIIRVFAARSVLRVWIELAVACGVTVGACWLIAAGMA